MKSIKNIRRFNVIFLRILCSVFVLSSAFCSNGYSADINYRGYPEDSPDEEAAAGTDDDSQDDKNKKKKKSKDKNKKDDSSYKVNFS